MDAVIDLSSSSEAYDLALAVTHLLRVSQIFGCTSSEYVLGTIPNLFNG
jgi:hypothetical protein